MPIVPGDRRRIGRPSKRWEIYDRGLLSRSEVVFAFLDDLDDDDIIVEVNNLSKDHREILLSFLRSISIEEIRPGLRPNSTDSGSFIGRRRPV